MPRNKICSLGNSHPLQNTLSSYILMALYHGVLFTQMTTTPRELDTSNQVMTNFSSSEDWEAIYILCDGKWMGQN